MKRRPSNTDPVESDLDRALAALRAHAPLDISAELAAGNSVGGAATAVVRDHPLVTAARALAKTADEQIAVCNCAGTLSAKTARAATAPPTPAPF